MREKKTKIAQRTQEKRRAVEAGPMRSLPPHVGDSAGIMGYILSAQFETPRDSGRFLPEVWGDLTSCHPSFCGTVQLQPAVCARGHGGIQLQHCPFEDPPKDSHSSRNAPTIATKK